jgi:CBS domain-containing protein
MSPEHPEKLLTQGPRFSLHAIVAWPRMDRHRKALGFFAQTSWKRIRIEILAQAFEPGDSLDEVVRQMTRHRVRSVPVVERARSRRQLVGMVSRGDLLRGFGKPPGSA